MGTVIQQKVPIASIIINDRLRKNIGDISSLAANIKELGLLSPIIINQDNKLLAGERRLTACKSLGWTEIPAIIKEVNDAEQELLIEIAENVNRESFTREELINAGIELERIEKVKAEERIIASQNNDKGRAALKNFTGQESKGNVRDIVAKKLGMSGVQYEREKFILQNRDLLSDGEFADWNSRVISTNKAFGIINKILNADADKVAKLETIISNLTAENENLKNSKYVYSSAAVEAETAYYFWKASDDFIKNTIAPLNYDEVIGNNQEGVCSEYIIKACNLLIDSATDILKRFRATDVVDMDY